MDGGVKAGGIEGLIFVGLTIGMPRTVLLEIHFEGSQVHWLYILHAFIEIRGTGGGNDGEQTRLKEEINRRDGGSIR